MGVLQAAFYNWKKRYSGLTGMELRWLKQIEEENKQLQINRISLTVLIVLFLTGFMYNSHRNYGYLGRFTVRTQFMAINSM